MVVSPKKHDDDMVTVTFVQLIIMWYVVRSCDSLLLSKLIKNTVVSVVFHVYFGLAGSDKLHAKEASRCGTAGDLFINTITAPSRSLKIKQMAARSTTNL